MTSLWVDPDGLRSVSPLFAQLGDAMHTALGSLKPGLESEGKCWGSDHPGEKFEEHYKPNEVDIVLTRLAAFETLMRTTGDNITTTADALQNQDRHNADQIPK
ncbi:hypothetical protein JK358_00495 [Nocardia sp. 2]|uniref:WXG100 family type VII secretion target n=1 Tax=Nocardia acididurans TaxID=2802282 RepID=A0ABS1LX35_9NOCA|nr:hypothetical protein [Nocardia acididurans]MBL1072867.1 hypothetical protein [Nocardia acididurans]